ncbi:MAG: hypothetical protein JJE29_01285 [Peptostreptococcaceae bacterium]|nr:hypothetical protein [Peptostreptococcaceae bacterium]
MQSSHKIYKNRQMDDSRGICPIPVKENPVGIREYSFDGQADSLIRQTKQRADELLRMAEQESKEIISAAEDEALEAVEEEKRKGYETGYKTGAEEGYGEGCEVGRQEVLKESQKKIDEAGKILKTAHKESRAYIQKTENEIIGLAVKIAETIIKKELELDDSIIVGIAKDALAEVRSMSQIVIRTGKQEAVIIQNNLTELQELCPNGVFTILRDETVQAGGCFIETDINIIDATVDKKLENVKRVLMETGQRHGK